jgi:peptidyl-tRNA hydrolase
MLQCSKCGEPHTRIKCGENIYCHNCELDKITKYYEENPVEPKPIFQEHYEDKATTNNPKYYPKMYILVKDTIPLGLAMNAVGHSALACYLKFKDDPIMEEWLNTSFRKVTCKVTEEEFERAKQRTEEHIVMTELTLDNAETAIAFKPTKEFSRFFNFLKLYKEN